MEGGAGGGDVYYERGGGEGEEREEEGCEEGGGGEICVVGVVVGVAEGGWVWGEGVGGDGGVVD